MLQLILLALSAVCATLPMCALLALVWWMDRYEREPLGLLVVVGRAHLERDQRREVGRAAVRLVADHLARGGDEGAEGQHAVAAAVQEARAEVDGVWGGEPAQGGAGVRRGRGVVHLRISMAGRAPGEE